MIKVNEEILNLAIHNICCNYVNQGCTDFNCLECCLFELENKKDTDRYMALSTAYEKWKLVEYNKKSDHFGTSHN